MTVAGVLVNTQVGHEHHSIANVFLQLLQGNLHNAIWVESAGANFVFFGRNTKQNDSGNAKVGKLTYFFAQ